MPQHAWRIAVVAGKGGVGKTTSVINIAASLAGSGRRCLVVDCDPQSNLTSGLGIDPYTPRNTIADVIAGQCTAQEAIVETATPGVHLLPAHPDLTSVEDRLPNRIGGVLRLRDALAEIPDGAYDAVLLDTPPNFQFHTISALAATKYVLVPLQMSAFALRGLQEVMRALDAARPSLNPEIELLGVAPTFVTNTNFSRTLHAMAKSSNARVFWSQIAITVKLQESALAGLPVSATAPGSAADRSYTGLTREIVAALDRAEDWRTLVESVRPEPAAPRRGLRLPFLGRRLAAA